MSNKWQIGPVKLANGEDAWIDAINEGQEVFLYTGRVKSLGQWEAAGWDETGRKMYNPTDCPRNLAPPPKKKVRVQRWVNVFEDGSIMSFATKERADKDAEQYFTVSRIALIEINREVEEGEGL